MRGKKKKPRKMSIFLFCLWIVILSTVIITGGLVQENSDDSNLIVKRIDNSFSNQKEIKRQVKNSLRVKTCLASGNSDNVQYLDDRFGEVEMALYNLGLYNPETRSVKILTQGGLGGYLSRMSQIIAYTARSKSLAAVKANWGPYIATPAATIASQGWKTVKEAVIGKDPVPDSTYIEGEKYSEPGGWNPVPTKEKPQDTTDYYYPGETMTEHFNEPFNEPMDWIEPSSPSTIDHIWKTIKDIGRAVFGDSVPDSTHVEKIKPKPHIPQRDDLDDLDDLGFLEDLFPKNEYENKDKDDDEEEDLTKQEEEYSDIP